jgi:hypothetical protein
MRTLFLIILFATSIPLIAQRHYSEENHHDVKYELGTALTMVYSPHTGEFGPGFHLHGVRFFNPDFGIGIGYEGAIYHDYHQAMTMFGEFILADFVILDVGPAIIFPNHEHPHYAVTAHVEAALSFDYKNLHIGPMIGFGIGKEESHYSLGVHIGWHFNQHKHAH